MIRISSMTKVDWPELFMANVYNVITNEIGELSSTNINKDTQSTVNITSNTIFPDMKNNMIALEYINQIIKESVKSIKEKVQAKINSYQSDELIKQKAMLDCLEQTKILRDDKFPIICKMISNEVMLVKKLDFDAKKTIFESVVTDLNQFYNEIELKYFDIMDRPFKVFIIRMFDSIMYEVDLPEDSTNYLNKFQGVLQETKDQRDKLINDSNKVLGDIMIYLSVRPLILDYMLNLNKLVNRVKCIDSEMAKRFLQMAADTFVLQFLEAVREFKAFLSEKMCIVLMSE